MIFLILRKCASIYEVFSTTAFRKQCTIQRNYISHIAQATCHVSPTAKHGTCLALQQLNRLTEKTIGFSVFNSTMQKIKSLMARQVGYFSSYISLLLDFIDESGSI